MPPYCSSSRCCYATSVMLWLFVSLMLLVVVGLFTRSTIWSISEEFTCWSPKYFGWLEDCLATIMFSLVPDTPWLAIVGFVKRETISSTSCLESSLKAGALGMRHLYSDVYSEVLSTLFRSTWLSRRWRSWSIFGYSVECLYVRPSGFPLYTWRMLWSRIPWNVRLKDILLVWLRSCLYVNPKIPHTH